MRRPLLLLASVLLTAGLVVPGVLLAGGPAPPAPPPALRPVATVGPDARSVLAAWDDRRAAAWAAGDVGALRRLYVAGSAAGRHDAALLARWTARGLRVTGLELELLEVSELRTGDDRLELRVTDRVAAGRAVGRGVDRPLPSDGPTTRRVTLVRTAGAWRVAEVR